MEKHVMLDSKLQENQKAATTSKEVNVLKLNPVNSNTSIEHLKELHCVEMVPIVDIC